MFLPFIVFLATVWAFERGDPSFNLVKLQQEKTSGLHLQIVKGDQSIDQEPDISQRVESPYPKIKEIVVQDTPKNPVRPALDPETLQATNHQTIINTKPLQSNSWGPLKILGQKFKQGLFISGCATILVLYPSAGVGRLWSDLEYCKSYNFLDAVEWAGILGGIGGALAPSCLFSKLKKIGCNLFFR